MPQMNGFCDISIFMAPIREIFQTQKNRVQTHSGSKLFFFGKCSLSLKTHFNAKMSEIGGKIFFKSLSENQKIQDGHHKNRNIAKNGTYVEKNRPMAQIVLWEICWLLL